MWWKRKRARRAGKLSPVAQRGVEHDERADDVRLDERARPIDRAVDVGLGGEVRDDVGVEARERLRDLGLLADIGADEAVARVARHALERGERAGVGQLVQRQHLVLAVADEVAHERRADEAGAAGDEHAHRSGPFIGFWLRLGRAAPGDGRRRGRGCRTPQASQRSVLGRQLRRRAARERPAHADRRVVPADAAVALRGIEVGDLVDDLGVRLGRQEAVGEADRHEQLLAPRPSSAATQRP